MEGRFCDVNAPAPFLKSDPIAQLKEIDRTLYENNFYKFFRAAWPYIDPAEFVDGYALQAIAEHLEAVCSGEIKRLIVNIPPRMSKSSLCSVAFPAWIWSQSERSATSGPGVQFVIASYGRSLALRFSTKTRRLIKGEQWYKWLWGDRYQLARDEDSKTRFDNTEGGSCFYTSIGATLTGEGGNIILTDDPNSAPEAFSEATIESTNEWWDGTASTRLNDPNLGAFVVVQQRLSEDDMTGHILEKSIGDWTHLVLPMRYEPDRSFTTVIGWQDWRTEPGELLWPERFDDEAVDALERTLGPFASAGQLQQRPEPKGGGVIKREWWRLWERPTYPPMDFILASLDTAYTIKQENDFSAMTVWGVFSGSQVAIAPTMFQNAQGKMARLERIFNEDKPGQLMLMDCWQERLEFPDLIKKVVETCKKMKVDKLIIENKAAGISLSQELRRLLGGENFSIQLIDPKSLDKLARLYSVQHIFSEGMVWAPDRSWSDMVITQVAQFPKGKHDDIPDTCSQALRHIRDMGLLTRAPERLAELEEQKTFRGSAPPPLYPV